MTYFKPKKGRVPVVTPSPEWTGGDVRRVLLEPVPDDEVDDPDRGLVLGPQYVQEHTLAYYPPADEAEIDNLGRVVPVRVSMLSGRRSGKLRGARSARGTLVIRAYLDAIFGGDPLKAASNASTPARRSASPGRV